MDEGILAAVIWLDESEAFGRVEPLYRSRSHGNNLSRYRHASRPRWADRRIRIFSGSKVEGEAPTQRGAARSSVRVSTASVWPLRRRMASRHCASHIVPAGAPPSTVQGLSTLPAAGCRASRTVRVQFRLRRLREACAPALTEEMHA